MVADSIEREITIAAPRARVWEVLTQPEFLGSWFGTGAPALIDPRPGGRILLDHGAHGPLLALIERLDPPAVFAFRWSQGPAGEDPADGTSTLVTFTLSTEPGDHTRLRMVENGFASLAFPREAVRTRFDRNGTGWTRKLTELACHTERLTLRR
ncbi:SRPBCC domain-containing protein [Kitasatospora sp. NPDC097605]|uniref:SRPBCC domain-containing protein n=1 Tax=Kitasatospora sp. NPDC097605 TaxID=3157226 RepID=UPI003332BD16